MNALWKKLFPRLPTFLWWAIAKRQLGSCGENVRLQKDGTYKFENVYIGNNVRVGLRAFLWAVNSRIYIGDKVAMGPEVIIMAGNRNLELRGKFICDVTADEKRPEDDQDVVFEEDVWVGARVTVLNGVHIGRGAALGAGAVVTKSVPPYCIAAGNPARVLRVRGSIEAILAHEVRLYSEEKRMERNQLERLLGAYLKKVAYS